MHELADDLGKGDHSEPGKQVDSSEIRSKLLRVQACTRVVESELLLAQAFSYALEAPKVTITDFFLSILLRTTCCRWLRCPVVGSQRMLVFCDSESVLTLAVFSSERMLVVCESDFYG